MLSIVERIENGQPVNLIKALYSALTVHFVRVLPLALLWTFLWTVLFIVHVIHSAATKRSGGGRRRRQISARSVARTLSGVSDSPFSIFKAGIHAGEKLIRMIYFLSLPGIVWGRLKAGEALRKSIRIAREHPVTFFSAYTMTALAGLVMMLPVIPVFSFAEEGVEFPPAVWTVVIVYSGIVWSIGVYLEQMSMALQYLWYLRWKQECGVGSLRRVRKPCLLDHRRRLSRGQRRRSPILIGYRAG
ncbi:MAG: hypothetical protein JJU00_18520 [Opitutales bacterium]|nr:hypothetical protein [Opitutales bacterium]